MQQLRDDHAVVSSELRGLIKQQHATHIEALTSVKKELEQGMADQNRQTTAQLAAYTKSIATIKSDLLVLSCSIV